MSISSNLVQVKINSGGVAALSQSLPVLHPEISPCPDRFAVDQYGRPSDPSTIDTETCPGLFSASNRIDVENSLRPFLSPTYFNLPLGISGGGDTLFGNAGSAGRAIDFTREVPAFATKNVQQNLGTTGQTLAQNADTLVRTAAQQNLGNVQINPNLEQGQTTPAGYIRLGNYNRRF